MRFLPFKTIQKTIIKTPNKKESVPIKVAPFMTSFYEKFIFNSLLWMFGTRAVNHKTNSLHEID